MTSLPSPSRWNLQSPGPTAAVILCDASPAWTNAWQRELGADAPLQATFLVDAEDTLRQYPHGVLVLAWRQQAAPQQIELLARVQARSPHVLCIALLEPAQAAWELLLREAGVRAVIRSPRDVWQAAPLVQKHLARAPRPKLSFHELVWQRLPWDAVKGTGDLP